MNLVRMLQAGGVRCSGVVLSAPLPHLCCFAGDPRTIYYLGHAHIEQIGPTPSQDVRTGKARCCHVRVLLPSVPYLSMPGLLLPTLRHALGDA